MNPVGVEQSSSEMPILYLHLGPHKTGTSYIQMRCADNAERLSQAGIVYPKSARQIEFGHHELCHALREGRTQAARRLSASILEESKGAHILLSSENFSTLKPEKMELLRSMFPEHAIHACFFVRRWHGALYARWQESVKHGSYAPAPAYMLPHLAKPFESNILNWSVLADAIATHLSPARSCIFVYDNLISRSQDVFDHICQFFLKIDSSSFARPDKNHSIINKSMGHVYTEIMRMVQLMIAGQSDYLWSSRSLGEFWRAQQPKASKEVRDAFGNLHKLLVVLSDSFLVSDSGPAGAAVARSFLAKHGSNLIGSNSRGGLFDEKDDRPISFVRLEEALVMPEVRSHCDVVIAELKRQRRGN